MDGFLKLDWLSFTYHVSSTDCIFEDGSLHSPFEVFCKNFPELNIIYSSILFDTGRFHYSHRFLFSDSIEINCCELISTTGKPIDFNYACKMGVNVSIPSHSLELFCNCFGIDYINNHATYDLLLLLRNRGCKFSRIDVCFDDYEKKYTAFDYAKFWVNDLISSHFQNTNIIGSTRKIGYTFYLGDRKHKMLRIYDKFYESSGIVDSVRYEFEYHSSLADKLVDFLIENEGNYPFKHLLLEWFRVLEFPYTGNNIDDVPSCNEWLNYVEKGQVNEELLIPNYNDKERRLLINQFVKRNIRSIYGFCRLNGLDSLYDLLVEIDNTDGRASPKYENYFKSLKARDPNFDLLNISDFGILNCDSIPFD